MIRTGVCGLIYAALWGVHAIVYPMFFGEHIPETWQIMFLAPPYALAGASVAYLCYDLDFGNGFFHYSLYLLVTVLLRVVMGLNPIYQPPPQVDEDLVRFQRPEVRIAQAEEKRDHLHAADPKPAPAEFLEGAVSGPRSEGL